MKTIKHAGAALLLALTAACGGDAAAEAAPPTVDTAAAAPAAPVDSAPAPAAAADTGFVDPNTAPREALLAIPGITAPAADALVAGRPYADMRGVNTALAAHLDSAALETVYARLWKPLNLNNASAEEIELIPGVGRRMRHEFEEYRPYNDMARFRREIGKYVDETEVARLERYVTLGQ